MHKLNVHSILLLVIMLMVANFSIGQGASDADVELANKLFDEGKYEEAAEKWSTILSLGQTNPDYNFKYGACLLFTEEDKSAGLKYLQYSMTDPEIDARAHFFLGKAYHLNYRFKEALQSYNKFKSKANGKQLEEYNVDQQIRMCNNGKQLLRNLSELVVISTKEVPEDRMQYSYDLSNIGGKILVTNEFESKHDKKVGHRAVVHFPSTRQDNIFFSSYGKDGKTGRDIYQVKKLPNGEWSEAQKLPLQVNTDADEDYGFLHPDGQTFYFCSKGHNSMGGYDVFKCTYNRETNSFGPAQNLDYKINTPDDDILYIVDSLNQNAYFASSRSAPGGYMDVYNVKVETYPILNAIIASTFNNDINPSNKAITVKVRDVIRDEVLGVYNSKNENGSFVVILPRSGAKYEYIIESPESEKVHTGIFEVPPQKEMRPLKQELLLVEEAGEERLIIQNLFDEDVENATDIMADVLKQMSDLKTNVANFQPVNTDSLNQAKIDEAELDGLTPEDLITLADEMAAESADELAEIEKKKDAAFFTANERMKSAKENAEKAEEVLAGIENVENPFEKQQLIDLADEYNRKAKVDNEVAAAALNLGNTLEKEYEERKVIADQESKYAADIKDALSSSSQEEAIKKLTEMKEYILENRKPSLDEQTALEELEKQARDKQGEADAAMDKAKQLRQDEQDQRAELSNLEMKYNLAKKKDQDAIQLQINDMKQLIAETEKAAERAFAQAKEVQKDADFLNEQVEAMALLYDDPANIVSGTLSEEERRNLEAEINSGEIGTSIAINETKMADNQVVAERPEDTTEAAGSSLRAQVDAIMNGSHNYDLDSVREALSDMPDGPEKARLMNEADQEAVDEINDEIAVLDEAIEQEKDEERKRQLDQRRDELIQERGLIEEDIANNNEVIKSADGSDEQENPLDEIVDAAAYDELRNRQEAANGIDDPKEKARVQQEIITEWIEDLTEDIAQVEERAEKEEDPLKQAQLYDEAEELKLQLAQKQDEEVEWAEYLANNQGNDQEVDWAIDEAKYDDFATQDDDLAGITDPANRAQAQLDNKQNWVSTINSDINTLETKLSQAPDSQKPEIEDKINELKDKKAELEDQIVLHQTELDDIAAASGTGTNTTDTTNQGTRSSEGPTADQINEGVTSLLTEGGDRLEEDLASITDSSPKSKAESENQIIEDYKDDLETAKADLITRREAASTDEQRAAYDSAINDIEQEIAKLDDRIAVNNETINQTEVVVNIIEPTSDYSYTDETEFTSADSKTAYEEIKDDLEDLNVEQIKLADLTIQMDEAEEGDKDKFRKKVDKQQEKVTEKELVIADKFEEIHAKEKNELLTSINESNALIKGSALSGTEEVGKASDKVKAVNDAFQEAAEIRTQASGIENPQERNNELKKAAAIEDAALEELSETAEALEDLADRVEVADNSAIDEQPEDESAPLTIVQPSSVADASVYETSASSAILEPVKEELDEIAQYEDEIDQLRASMDGASERDQKKTLKKINKLEKKKNKKEAEVAPEIADANATEFGTKQAAVATVGRDVDDIATNNDGSYNLERARDHEKVADEQFMQAEELRRTAENIRNKAEKNDSLKKASDIERMAIMNMGRATDYYKKAAQDMANFRYPRSGAEVPENPEDRISAKQQQQAIELAQEADELKEQAGALRDSSQNLKNEDARNMLLSDADKMDQQAAQKKALSDILLYSSDDLAEEEKIIVEDQQLVASLTDDDANSAMQTPEYKENYEAFIKRLDKIEAEIKTVEAEQRQLRAAAATDRSDAADLRQNATLTSDPIEQQDYMDRAADLQRSAQRKEAEADSLENVIESLVQQQRDVRSQQDAALDAMDKPDLATVIKAISRSDMDKTPIVPVFTIDTNTIATSDFQAPDSLTTDIVVIDETVDQPSYSEDNPIPINPKMPEGLIYRVQVGAFRRPIPQDLFKGFAPITGERIRDDITRYRVGYFTKFTTANDAKNEIRRMGYSDAFVVAIYNGDFISLNRAREMEREALAGNTNLATSNPTNGNNGTAAGTNNGTATNNTVTAANNGNDTSANTTTGNNGTTPPDVTYYDDVRNRVPADEIEASKGLFYTVQIGAYSRQVTAADLYNIQPLNVQQAPNGLLRYSTGKFTSVESASSRKNEIRQIGISDAFVTVYYNGERVTFAEARDLIDQYGDAVFETGGGNTSPTVIPSVGTGVDGLEYIVDLGTYKGGVPSEIGRAMLPHGSLINREFKDSATLTMTSGPLKTYSQAEGRKDLFVNDGVTSASIRAIYNGEQISLDEARSLESGGGVAPPSGEPKAIEGLKFRVYLGNYRDGVSVTRSAVFVQKQSETATVESVEESDGSKTYYCGKSPYLAEAEKNKKIFVEAGIGDAKVVAFFNGEEISLNEAIQKTLE